MQQKTRIIFSFALITIILTLYTSDSYAQKTGYELVWQDEFNGSELDLTKWQHRGLDGTHYRHGSADRKGPAGPDCRPPQNRKNHASAIYRQ